MTFEDEPVQPLIHILETDISDQDCHLLGGEAGACDFILGMRYMRFSGIEPSAAPAYAGRLVCHGQRAKTQAEQADAQLLGKDPESPVCDIEMIIARDF